MTKLTREQMQTQALVIESLIAATLSMHGEDDIQDCMTILEMAMHRANKLNVALDSVNCPAFRATKQTEGVAA